MHERFFSIIIPAYNEEKIIDRTLSQMAALDYPNDRYEVIVVENASTDATLARAKAHESATIHVYAAPSRGVSRARNYGLSKVSALTEWCIFIDCDDVVGKDLLAVVNRYIETHPDVGYGTTTVTIDSDAPAARFWSRVNNFFYRFYHVLFTIHLVRRDFASRVQYDENLISGEDIQYGRDLARLGARYFFVPTDQVRCSDRRYVKKGYTAMFFINLYHGITCYILPEGMLKKIDWEAIR